MRFLMYDHIMEMVRLASPGGRKAGWHSLACGGVAGTPPRDSEPRSCSWGARHICDLKSLRKIFLITFLGVESRAQAGTATTLLFNPVDVIKSRMQASQGHCHSTFYTISRRP